MGVLTLISTPVNIIPTQLMQLLCREGVPFRVECWSFRWWHCPNCACKMPSAGHTGEFLACCAGCGTQCTCVKRSPGVYVAVGPVIDKLPPIS